jgi:hypothetical protein
MDDSEENIKKWIAFYGCPLLISTITFIPILCYQGTDLSGILTGIYSIYITIATIILSIVFVVLSVAPTFIKIEQKNLKNSKFSDFLNNSVFLMYVVHRILALCFMGIIFSLLGYILTSVHALLDLSLRFLFWGSSFFVIGAIFGLALLTGVLIENLAMRFSNSVFENRKGKRKFSHFHFQRLTLHHLTNR